MTAPARAEAAQRPVRSRLCRTPAECFAAGWEDGEHDKPLTEQETTRLVALWAPSQRRIPATTTT